MNDGIMVAMAGTVTLTTEDYDKLIVARTLLESILGYQKAEDSYRLCEFIKVIRGVYEPVITADSSNQEGSADA